MLDDPRREKPYNWYVPLAVAERYNHLIQQLFHTDEFSEERHRLLDELRSLPGFPSDFDVLVEEGFYLKPVVNHPERNLGQSKPRESKIILAN